MTSQHDSINSPGFKEVFVGQLSSCMEEQSNCSSFSWQQWTNEITVRKAILALPGCPPLSWLTLLVASGLITDEVLRFVLSFGGAVITDWASIIFDEGSCHWSVRDSVCCPMSGYSCLVRTGKLFRLYKRSMLLQGSAKPSNYPTFPMSSVKSSIPVITFVMPLSIMTFKCPTSIQKLKCVM